MPDPACEILIDCNPVETRVALLEGGKAAEIYFERSRRRGSVGDIYLGRVSRVLPGMQAAFVDIGLPKDAFLYVSDVRTEWDEDEAELAAEEIPRPSPSIDERVKEGQQILVQVVKESIGAKGARVTTNISLPGRFLVVTPFSPRHGVSRRIEDEAERERLKAAIESLSGGGFIARTAALGRSAQEFESDRQYLAALWASIEQKAASSATPALLHREQDLLLRAVRDLVSEQVTAIRTNDHEAYGRLVEFLNAVEPSLSPLVKLQRSPFLFEEFGVEAEIDKLMKSKVWLKSGGYLVINPTEALVAIDVNTGKYVGKDNLEETVLSVNLEAAREIVRQIRLRDLGGIIVIDFIDLEKEENRRALFEALEGEMKKDRAKSKILEISEFGLVQITRKRSRPSLDRALTQPCPACGGEGRVMNDFTLAMEIRREILKMSRSFSAGDTVLVRLPAGAARLLREEENRILQELELDLEVSIVLKEEDSLSPSSFELAVI